MPFPVKLLVLLSLVLTGCATGAIKTGKTEGELRGMLYDFNREPVADAKVTVTAGNSRVSVLTDLHGRFGLSPLPFGPVKLEASKDGYENLDWNFRFTESTQVLYLQQPNSDQLFERAAEALEKKDWQNFRLYVERAKLLSPENLQGYILEATELELKGDWDGAISVLTSYGGSVPVFALEVFLGDLYNKVGDRDKAKLHWSSALRLRDDPQVRAKWGAL